eukprot:COSAG06_NODE_20478_length_794_cov_0.942446_1_plen_48_part_10
MHAPKARVGGLIIAATWPEPRFRRTTVAKSSLAWLGRLSWYGLENAPG